MHLQGVGGDPQGNKFKEYQSRYSDDLKKAGGSEKVTGGGGLDRRIEKKGRKQASSLTGVL